MVLIQCLLNIFPYSNIVKKDKWILLLRTHKSKSNRRMDSRDFPRQNSVKEQYWFRNYNKHNSAGKSQQWRY